VIPTCCEDDCTQPCVSYVSRGKVYYRKRCRDHYRTHHRNAVRKKRGTPIPEYVGALPPGRYIIIDLINHICVVVDGDKRGIQPYPKETVNPNTVRLLGLKKFTVTVLKPVSRTMEVQIA
jgi:hypothetical protein